MSSSPFPAARPGTSGLGLRVLVVSGSVGAGHDGAARELAARLVAAGTQVAVRDFLDAVPRPIARVLREGYLTTVTHVPFAFEFLFRRLERRGVLWAAEEAVCRSAEAGVGAWLAEHRPDVVVSTYPLASQTLGALRADGRLGVPAVTYLTDPAVHRSWLHPAVDEHVTVTAATAAQGRADYGMAFTVGGPLVPARFSTSPTAGQRAALRGELGLPEGRRVALLSAGSLAVGDVVGMVGAVTEAGFTALVLCGRNGSLHRRVAGERDTVALGWRSDVHRLLHAADVMVQNAGGLSFTEAMVAGLPAVTYRPIPGHGRANARVLDAAGLAPWARTQEELHRQMHAALRHRRVPPSLPDPTGHILAAVPAAAAVVPAA